MRLLKVLLIILILTGCRTTPEEISTSLLGVVYDYKSNPLKSASIILKNEKEEYKVSTDIDGKFMVPDMEFGEYEVTVECKGYKTTTTTMSHLDSQNVLIVRVYSYDDLLLKLQEHIGANEMDMASKAIESIEDIRTDDIYFNYLKSIYYIERGDYDYAESTLLKLEERSSGEAYISLLLADLYEYNLNNKKLAIYYLKRFLNREYTLTESNRLKELESAKEIN